MKAKKLNQNQTYQQPNRTSGTLLSRTTKGTFSQPLKSAFDRSKLPTQIVPRWG
jgi:hypothetical protein